MKPVYETKLDLPLVARGKVRDIYEFNNNLLLVSTDRLSAFDVVFTEPIPNKGQVLNQLSLFWFDKTNHIVKNHVVHNSYPADFPDDMKKRSIVGVKAKPIMLECVVRGYLTGSGLSSYKKDKTVCGIKLPDGLHDGSKLPEPLFTPSTKAPKGQHDENITLEQAIEIIGESTFIFVKQKSLELYKFARDYSLEKGLVLADTKFEFGKIGNDIILIDEALTPDSSRYWLKEEYDKGNLVSLDKQFVRDYVSQLGWNKSPPAPKLPKDVIKKTTERYLQTYMMITGKNI
ncbi:MAG TPA: phosphoribosylaminoimidazolesuccinocarboxamide synthase [Candidatus Bilamarchaeaceae archaeon]|nr:phosphoribosylaminoimidazolesuccinocarboxamide synthase [Candidatus Bilamarchaeaceae archaeon]